MKPSKKKAKKRRKLTPSSESSPPQSNPLGGGGNGGGSNPQSRDEDEEKRALDWLVDAFALASFDQIDSAYREAGGDAYRTAGILGTELEDPGDPPAAADGGKKGSGVRRKPKRVAAASTGMVSNVIRTGHAREGRRSREARYGATKGKGAGSQQQHSVEEAEQFLCSVLGDDSELGMGVVKDVLSQCGSNVGKALDALLDLSSSSSNLLEKRSSGDYMTTGIDYSTVYPEISSDNHPENIMKLFQLRTSDSAYHPSEKEHESLQYVGFDCSKCMDVLVDPEEQLHLKSGLEKPDLQQNVLESLFNIPDFSKHEPNCMDWKKIVKKVGSFGQIPSVVGTVKSAENGKEDGYQEFRGVARKHWDMMKTFYQKAAIAYSRGERAHASYLSEKGKYYRNLAREADEKASQDIFEARNKGIKNTVTIDLHGQHVEPAIRLLKLHLVLFTYIPSIHFLKVITGCGAHGIGKGKLKHSVIGLVEKEGIEWSEENVGTLVLRIDGLKEYSFKESDSDSDYNLDSVN